MSVGPSKQGNIQLNQQWDTVSLPIALQDNNWGISRELNEPIIQMIEALGLYTDISGNRVFTINVLKVLVKYMHQRKMEMSNLPEAVGKLMADHQRQLTLETMKVLITFFSNFPGPKGIVPFDGVWNQASAILLEKVAEDYQLEERSPTPKLLKQLRTISKRVLRANLKEKLPSDSIEGNSFFVFDTEETNWILTFNSEDDSSLYLTDVGENKQLARIDWRSREGGRLVLQSFEKFSKWMMLLMMKGNGIYYDYADLRIGKDGNQPATIGNFFGPTNGKDFIIQVDYLLNFPNQYQNFPLHFFPKEGNDINVIAVLFSEDLNVAITQGYRTGPHPENGTSALIDFEYFFRKVQNNEPVQFLHKANFLKLFIVRNSFGRNGNDFTINPSDIVALLKAEERDILSTVTFGLNFDSRPPDEKYQQMA